jgi:hypothetical protein
MCIANAARVEHSASFLLRYWIAKNWRRNATPNGLTLGSSAIRASIFLFGSAALLMNCLPLFLAARAHF